LTFAQRIAAALGTLVVGLVAAGIAINFARRRLEYLAKTNQAITDQVDTWKNPLSSPIDKVVAGVLAFLLRTGSTSSTGGHLEPGDRLGAV